MTLTFDRLTLAPRRFCC